MKTIVKVVVGVLLVLTLYTALHVVEYVVEDAKPKYGLLTIRTIPPGADVFCDGIYEGTASSINGLYGEIYVEGLIGNTVTIKVEKSRYHTVERRIRITRDNGRTGVPDFSDRTYYGHKIIEITLQKKQFWE